MQDEVGVLNGVVDDGLRVEGFAFGGEESGGKFEREQTIETAGFGALEQAGAVVPVALGQQGSGIVGTGAVLQVDVAY